MIEKSNFWDFWQFFDPSGARSTHTRESIHAIHANETSMTASFTGPVEATTFSSKLPLRNGGE